jgi:hypothetical protein
MRHLKTLLCCGLASLCISAVHAQGGILNKMRRVGNTVADKVLEKKVDEAVNGQDSQNNSSSGNTGNTGKNNPTNKGGQGLISTPPDVKENLASAETAFKSGNYSDARYAVQQAMLGVELEIGQKILKSMPPAIAGLKKDTTEDKVTSTGWGWAGLTITREYKGADDKQFNVTIANNAAWMSAVELYFNNAGYAQSTNGEQKFKQVKIKDHRALIEYADRSGYKISIPLGQTSLMILEGVNFKTEQEMIKAANELDLAGIKDLLGEK